MQRHICATLCYYAFIVSHKSVESTCMRKHTLHVDEWSFQALLSNRKRVEFRRWDEKRQRIRPGDLIEFAFAERRLTRRVQHMLIASSFETLTRILPQIRTSGIGKRHRLLQRIRDTYPGDDKDVVVAIYLEELPASSDAAISSIDDIMDSATAA